jgi:hypothetical protein
MFKVGENSDHKVVTMFKIGAAHQNLNALQSPPQKEITLRYLSGVD